MKEKDKRIVWLETLRKPHINIFEVRVEELRKLGYKLSEVILNKYRCNEGR